MKSSQIFRSIVIAAILALMIIAIPATPALAQTVYATPSHGPEGTTVTLTGENFDANESVRIFFPDKDTFVKSAPADGVGSFSTSFITGEYPGGTHKIWAYGMDSTVWVYKNFTVDPEIDLDETFGYVSDEATVKKGTGFAANSDITIYFGSEEFENVAKTNANGTFTNAAFIVPESYNGSHTVRVTDEVGNDDTDNFSTKQSVTINPTTGSSGDSATLSGTGFKARKGITITFGGFAVTTVPPSVTTDDYGSFSGSFPVPIVVTGIYEAKATDGTNKASANFTVTSGASIDKKTGHVGTEITVRGTGFTVGAQVTITYAGEEVATTTPDTNGAFAATFPAPPSKHGKHPIVAMDTANPANNKTFTFTMESEPPPTPAPLMPEEGIKAEAEAVLFDWKSVDDPSGVTYTLQVATDDKFTEASVILEKKDLTDSEYTMTKEEKLESTKKEEPYYWRVRAIDGASNASDWSTPGSFYVGFQWPELKGWILYTLIGIGAVLLLGLGYWLGRRTAY